MGATAACDSGARVRTRLPSDVTRAAPIRFLEARLAEAPAYAACDTTLLPTGRCAPLPAPGSRAFTNLALVTERVAAAWAAGVADARAVGLAELAWHDGGGRGMDRAVAALTDGLAAAPGHWRLGNDLAAALLARAAARGSRLDALRALDALEGVGATGGGEAAWLFNRALALEKVGLWDMAADAWEAFLGREPDSGWSREAAQRLRRAAEAAGNSASHPDSALVAAFDGGDGEALAALAARNPRHARELAMARLIPDAVRASARGSSPSRRLGGVEAIGNALTDRSVTDLVADVHAAEAGGAAALGRLATALNAFESASLAWQEGRYEPAIALFTVASDEASHVSPTLAAWARLGVGTGHLTLFRYEEAQRAFEDVLAAADESRHILQVGRALWGQGLIAARTGRPEVGWQLLGRAGELYRRAGESENAAFLLTTAAELLSQLGRPLEAWPFRLEALAALTRDAPSTRLHYALWHAAEAALADGLPHAAALLQDADVSLGRRLRVEWLLSEALVRRGRIRHQLGDGIGAREDVAEARAVAAGIASPEVRTRALADVWHAGAMLVAEADPTKAAALLDSAIRVHQGLGNVIYVATALTARARARTAAGQLDAAEDDLSAAVHLIERQRGGIGAPLLGVSFGDAWHEVFDEAITFQIRQRRAAWSALDYAERSRRLLQARPHAGAYGNWDGADEQPQVPPGTLMLQFVVAEDAVYRWAVGPRERRFDVLPIPADSLASLARTFSDAVRGGLPDRGAGALLGSLLMPRETGAPASRLVLVPDAFLNTLPFGALTDPWSGGRVAERAAVSLASSFGGFLSLAGGHAGRGPTASALLVGNPSLGPGSLLPELPGAEREVRAVSRLYAGGHMLLGAQATRRAFLQELDRHPVAHYAGHAFFDEESPDASYLALAGGESGHADRLYLRELAGTSFSTLRLVVLSACGSVAPTLGRGGGLWGLALPFLEGGVSHVVGTLWPVNDQATAGLMEAFHAALLGGADPARALAEAQRKLLQSFDPALASPATWAAFVVLGR